MLQLFRENVPNKIYNLIQNKFWSTKFSYFADIFEHLNKLNTSMQGNRENIFTTRDKICATGDKVTIWRSKVEEGNLDSLFTTAEFKLNVV